VADIAPEPAPAPKKAATVKAVPAAKNRRRQSQAAAEGKAVAAVLKAAPAVLKAAADTVEAKGKSSPRGKVTPITAEAPHPAKHKPNEVAIKSSTSRHADQTGATKMFVLDTNVLMHDPSSLFRFEEHDVYLPMMTLEELDNHKKGMTEVARNARQVSRTLDALVSNTDDDAIENGIPLSKLGNKDAKGRLYFQTRLQTAELPVGLPSGKADNQILSVVRSLEAEQEGRAIVLVSKDINMRIKARALGLPAEDYFNDHVLEDTDLLYSGIVQLPDDFWNKHGKDLESWQENKTARARRSTASPVRRAVDAGQPVRVPRAEEWRSAVLWPGQADQRQDRRAANPARLQPQQEQRVGRHRAQPRAELRAEPADESGMRLRHPARPGRHRQDPAGAGGRPGAGAGDQALQRNHRHPRDGAGRRGHRFPAGHRGRENVAVDGRVRRQPRSAQQVRFGRRRGAATQDLIRSRIKIKSLNFMRGRTFVNKFLIIDEAQNLTPKQMKTLVTRAGPAPRSSAWATSRRSTRLT
jgi:hypothetical protein